MEELNPGTTSGQPVPENASVELTDVVQNEKETQSSPVKKITLMKGCSAIFNGLGIGLLLGILLGLSISPVVSTVIAAISAALGLFLGPEQKYLDPLKSLRIGAFGFFAVCGIMIGLYIRANDVFAPTMLEKKNDYVALGYSEEEARAFITKSIQSDTTKTNVKPVRSIPLSSMQVHVMFYLCDRGYPAAELINTFTEAGGTWKELAESFQNRTFRRSDGKSLISMRDCFCGLATGEIKMINRDSFDD